MPYPNNYTQSVNLTEYAGNNPASPYNPPDHDREFANIQTSLSAVVALLRNLTRSDGQFANNSIKPEALSTIALQIVTTGWKPRGNWATGTAYAVGDLVEGASSISFVCAVAHTSAATIDIDRGYGRWVCIGNGTTAAVDSVISYASQAVAAKDAAVVAKGQAEAAVTAAGAQVTNAQTYANNAGTSATAANASAVSAAASATTASTKATEASNSATAAAASAVTAGSFASGWQGANNVFTGTNQFNLGLTIGGTGQRIKGDFSNATLANRVMFQTSTVNGTTSVAAIPNGAGAVAQFIALPDQLAENTSYALMQADSSQMLLASGKFGTGSYRPMNFYTSDSERMRIDTAGNVGIGYTPSYKLHVNGEVCSKGVIVDGTGAYVPGVIYTDPAWGMLFRAKTASPTQADFMWANSGGIERMRIGAAGEFGVGGANYGTSGQVLTSGGAGAAPSWTTMGTGLGVAQTWQNVTGSRVVGTTYTNSTGKPIAVSVYGPVSAGSGYATMTVAGVQIGLNQVSTAGINVTMQAIVPAGATYVIGQAGGTFTPTVWAELRT